MSKTIDYDAPRRPLVELDDDSLVNLKVAGESTQSPRVDLDDADVADTFELPGAVLYEEELSVPVVPMMSDEFRCARCFLVRHRSQLARRRDGGDICTECA
ncbi:DUF4193 family protein [Planosporangium sp. 12N6]|uniref:DUF4193 family protein n=1 Tax=Planosporangium spinosum TaxID=3402278 RepID=UPI003CF75EEB